MNPQRTVGLEDRALEDRALQLPGLIELIDGVVWEADPASFVTTFISPRLESLFGFSSEAWLSDPLSWEGRLHPEDREWVLAETRAAMLMGVPYRMEYRLITASGTALWIRDVVTPVLGEDGALLALGGVMFDVTEQRQGQEALLALQQRQQRMFEANPVGVSLSVMESGVMLEANPAFQTMTGYSEAELTDQVVLDGTLRSREVELRGRDGVRFAALVSYEVLDLGGQRCLLALTQDVRVQQQAERAARRSDARFRAMVDSSADLFTVLGEDGCYLYVSPAVTRLFGVTPQSLIGRFFADFVHRDDRASLLADFQALLAHPREAVVSTYRQRLPDGRWVWTETTSRNLLDSPDLVGVVCSSRDVTERLGTQGRLEISEARFRSLVQNAADLITVIGAEGEVLYVSPSAEAVLGMAGTDRRPGLIWDAVHPQDLSAVRLHLRQLRLNGAGARGHLTFRVVTAQGRVRTLDSVVTNLLSDASVGGVVVNSRDVTDRHEARRALAASQERLMVSEKLASLGRLTAGLAHEINTPLAATMSFLKLTEAALAEFGASIGHPDVTEVDLREILAEANSALAEANRATFRIGEFIRQIRGHTRDTVAGRRAFDPVALTSDTLAMVAHEARAAGVDLHFEQSGVALSLHGDPGRFTQVVTNLVVNAIHACEGQERRTRVDVRFLPGEVLTLQVEDNGSGIPAEVLPHIFDPMFTTKGVGKGTGLGLSILHDIVRAQFGGTIAVQTGVGQGSVFSVTFPGTPDALRP